MTLKTRQTELLTVSEVASMLRVARNTVYGWIQSGKLKRYKVGTRAVRIKRGDVEKFIDLGA